MCGNPTPESIDPSCRVRLDREVDQAEVSRGSRLAPVTLLAGAIVLVGLVLVGLAAPGAYNVYKMLHVVAVVLWVGGAAMIAVLALLTERENDPKALASLGQKAEYLSTRLFIPSSLAVLVFGIAICSRAISTGGSPG